MDKNTAVLVRAPRRATARAGQARAASISAANVQLAILLLPLLVVPFFGLVDNDFWWHLRTGELIVRDGFVRSDPFSWTAAGEHWVTHEWLSEALIYVVDASAGYWANALLFGSIAAWALVIPYRMARQAGAGARATVLVTAVSVAILTTFVTVRPQVFTWLLFAAFVAILHGHLSTHAAGPTVAQARKLWALPLLTALWANLHLGFFFGFMVLGAWIAATAWEKRSAGALRTPVMITSACVVAACLTPEGPGLLLYPLRYLTDAAATHENVREWQSPDPLSPFHAPIFVGIALLAAASLSPRRPSPFLLLVSLGVIVLGLQAVRNAPLVGVVLPAIVAPVLARHWRAASAAADTDVRIGPVTAAGLAGLTVALGCALMLSWNSGLSLREPDERGYPAGGAAHVRAQHPGARLFNEYGWGGYLIYKLYPDVPVGIDGRTDFYGNRRLADYYTISRAEDGWRELLASYGAEVVLVPRESPLAKALRSDPEWVEEFASEREAVFALRDGAAP